MDYAMHHPFAGPRMRDIARQMFPGTDGRSPRDRRLFTEADGGEPRGRRGGPRGHRGHGRPGFGGPGFDGPGAGGPGFGAPGFGGPLGFGPGRGGRRRRGDVRLAATIGAVTAMTSPTLVGAAVLTGTLLGAVTGVALRLAVNKLLKAGIITTDPIMDHVAAVSCGVYAGQPVLDLDYAEDSEAGTDGNFIMTGSGRLIEVQMSAEGATFSRPEMNQLMDLAESGIAELVRAQKEALV